MDPNFVATNRHNIYEAVQGVSITKLEQMLALAKSASFKDALYADDTDPSAKALIDFGEFVQGVMIQARTYMREQADTPDKMAAGFAYLTGMGVSFPDGAP